jgi:hypothetical protein
MLCVQAEPSNAHLNEKEFGKGQFLGWLLDAGRPVPLVVYGIAQFG